MPQSLAQLYTHLIFSTKNREPILRLEDREKLQAYLGGILRELKSPVLAMAVLKDHVHLLYRQSKNLAVAKVVEGVKAGSSKWIKSQGPGYRNYHWQAGYGAFSVSHSKLGAVIRYIENQEEHHKAVSFQDELRRFLKEYELEYDERYVWD